jgi:hypothetical protein
MQAALGPEPLPCTGQGAHLVRLLLHVQQARAHAGLGAGGRAVHEQVQRGGGRRPRGQRPAAHLLLALLRHRALLILACAGARRRPVAGQRWQRAPHATAGCCRRRQAHLLAAAGAALLAPLLALLAGPPALVLPLLLQHARRQLRPLQPQLHLLLLALLVGPGQVVLQRVGAAQVRARRAWLLGVRLAAAQQAEQLLPLAPAGGRAVEGETGEAWRAGGALGRGAVGGRA